ncbi:hypothetical protein SBDP1_190021 [Syntrophobacter sp. SbD1]|nr:hypothetical protein SBDP1_190021 [Syntrophobacter sp. SbD1]
MAAGAIVEGAVVVSAAIVTAPFATLSCGSCGVSLWNPAALPPFHMSPAITVDTESEFRILDRPKF